MKQMELYDIIKTAIGASIPILIFYFGYHIKRRQDRAEGKHRNRIRLELELSSFGPQKGYYIAELTILLHNEGLVRNFLNELQLSIRGIEKDKEIILFKKKGEKSEEVKKKSIANFPIEIVNTNILARKDKKNDTGKKEAWFVEPGVIQRFSHVVRIPEDIRFILVQSSFWYHNNSEHTAQKVFEL